MLTHGMFPQSTVFPPDGMLSENFYCLLTLQNSPFQETGKPSGNSTDGQCASKYSILIVVTRRNTSLCLSKNSSVPLILEYCVIRSGWRSFPSTLFTVQRNIKYVIRFTTTTKNQVVVEFSFSDIRFGSLYFCNFCNYL